MSIYQGSLRLNAETAKDFKTITEITGILTITGKAKVELYELNSVMAVVVEDKASLNLPNCHAISGDVLVGEEGRFTFFHTSELKNVIVKEKGYLSGECKKIKTLDVISSSQVSLYKCDSVDDDIRIHDGVVHLGKCKSVGGSIYVSGDATLSLAACENVAGNITAFDNSDVLLPACTRVGGTIEPGLGCLVDLSSYPVQDVSEEMLDPILRSRVKFKPLPLKVPQLPPDIDYDAIRAFMSPNMGITF